MGGPRLGPRCIFYLSPHRGPFFLVTILYMTELLIDKNTLLGKVALSWNFQTVRFIDWFVVNNMTYEKEMF